MGNQQCCQAGNKGEDKNQKVQLVDYHPEILPELSEPVRKVLEEKKPFENQLKAEPQIVTKQYGEEFYEGPIDLDNRPQGYGKMYKKDGSLVISYWKQGKSDGPSIFVFPDGSYYEGILVNNKAEDQTGRYVNAQLTYEGGFHQNAFHGKGNQSGPGYSFQGEYVNGRKTKGTLKWKQDQEEYEYIGEFNQNFQFQNEGTLKEGQIGVYQGTFVNGKKNGKGIYTYIKNDVRYEGEYKDGVKCGNGTVYNHDNTIAFSGNFGNDLPNGQGYVIDNGKKTYAQFKDGIDVQRLPAC